MLVKCKIVREIYASDDFRIFACEPTNDNETEVTLNDYKNFCITGKLPYLTVNEVYTLEVTEIDNPKFGKQYKVESVPSLETYITDFESITEDMNFHMLCQIMTPQQATYVHSAYPNFCKLILMGRDEEIDVKNIYNVKHVRFEEYKHAIKEKFRYYYIMNRYKCFNMSFDEARMLSDLYPQDIQMLFDKIDKNPYAILILYLDRSFKNADDCILSAFPELADSDIRVEALMLDLLKKNELEGNTKMHANVLAFHIKGIEPLLIKRLKPVVEASDYIYYNDDTKDIAIQLTHDRENFVASFISDKLNNSTKLSCDWKSFQNVDDFNLTDMQLNALKNLCEYSVSLLVGYSGSGKTSTTKAMINMLDEYGYSYTLLCPTGKASKRLHDCTNRPATTIHKAVYSGSVYGHVIIVDECSMINLEVAYMLCRALLENQGCRIVFIGDNAQLLPIGCGNIFHDIISSNRVPTTMLTDIFRYNDNGSLYVATNIRQGIPYLKSEDDIQFGENFISKQSANMLDDIINEYKGLIDQGISYHDIMCLSPFNVGNIGSYSINSGIQSIVNPPKDDEQTLSYNRGNTTIIFRTGDLVINTKNNYHIKTYEAWLREMAKDSSNDFFDFENEEDEEEIQLETVIYNGEMGTIREISKSYMVVQFDEELVVLYMEDVFNLLLGYCISVHRSQGSESPYVISVVSPKHFNMLNRNMLYVANTRSSGKHIEIRDMETVNEAIEIAGQFERETFLRDMLTQKINLITEERKSE